MSVDLAVGTPLATALQNLVQPKLAEHGWTTGGLDDSALSEYIILMLANGKTQDQISSELSNDLLDLGPNNPETAKFAQWLFEQLNVLQSQLNGGQQTGANDAEAANNNGSAPNNTPSLAQDAEMGDAAESTSGTIPTGPKAMRSGSGIQKPRDKRMLNQLNKALDRSDESALHRIRGASGTGRINSHSREPPKGPRSQQVGRGIAAMANGRGMGGMAQMGGMNGMNNMPAMNNMNGMQGMPMPQMGQNGPMGQILDPQQQMMLLQMYEQQAQMMQQLFSSNGQPSAYINPNFQGNRNAPGKSIFERVDKSSKSHDKRQPQQSTKFTKKEGQDEAMTDTTGTAENGEGTSAMEVESGRADPSQTMCKFNLTCTRPDCSFVHQSPAAPPGISVDMSDTCSFGVACMNKKCAGKHPSPAQKEQHKAEVDCIYWPRCQNPSCPFKHPSMPPCRNGADCTVPNCKFAHSTVMCKYNPCTNPHCIYKHAEGQKKTFTDKVWTAPKEEDGEKKDHVSERKFVDESAEEELILPGRANQETEIMT